MLLAIFWINFREGMTRCESYPPCFGTIYFPTVPHFDQWSHHIHHRPLILVAYIQSNMISTSFLPIECKKKVDNKNLKKMNSNSLFIPTAYVQQLWRYKGVLHWEFPTSVSYLNFMDSNSGTEISVARQICKVCIFNPYDKKSYSFYHKTKGENMK